MKAVSFTPIDASFRRISTSLRYFQYVNNLNYDNKRFDISLLIVRLIISNFSPNYEFAKKCGLNEVNKVRKTINIVYELQIWK